ncbi:hypothetical protein Ddc_00514 [Ditylenchus destructor]|nr:hypothetical protein Ddc_00514 [Ditylenchus destructor]
MPHWYIRRLLNDPRVIERMADSRIMRQVARLFVSGIFRAHHMAEKSQITRSVSDRTTKFFTIFNQEFKKSIEKLQKGPPPP